MGNVIGFKTFADSGNNNTIHETIEPAEVRPGEGISCKVMIEDQAPLDVKVWRISPLGIEIKANSLNLKKGDQLNLKISIFSKETIYEGLIVDSSKTEKEGEDSLIGLRWFPLKDQSDGEDKDCQRKAKRFDCNEHFLPTAVSSNPIRFNDFLFFKVINFSSSGFLLSTSLRNKYLIPGMKLDSKISLPLFGDFPVSFKVIHARVSDGKLKLGCELLDPTKSFSEAMANYVFQFGENVSVKDLKDAGLIVTKSSPAIEQSFVKTATEYKEVLKLRRRAYIGSGKLDEEATMEDCSDIFDARSRIFLAKYRKAVIGSFRIIYHEPYEKLEHERFLEYPDSFPRKDEVVEVTRVCTHPDFRGSDILYYLMKHMVLTTILSGRRYIIGSAAGSLTDYYVKIGFKRTGVYFPHADLANKEHELLIMDCAKALSGQTVGVRVWNDLYSDIFSYLEEKQLYNFTTADTIRMNFRRAFLPISSKFNRSKKGPRRSN